MAAFLYCASLQRFFILWHDDPSKQEHIQKKRRQATKRIQEGAGREV